MKDRNRNARRGSKTYSFPEWFAPCKTDWWQPFDPKEARKSMNDFLHCLSLDSRFFPKILADEGIPPDCLMIVSPEGEKLVRVFNLAPPSQTA